MSKKTHKIGYTKEVAKQYMTILPHTRNSNLELLKEIWIDEADIYGVDQNAILMLISLIKEQKMTNPLTIARSRCLVLEDIPEWRTNNAEQDERDYIEEINNAR